MSELWAKTVELILTWFLYSLASLHGCSANAQLVGWINHIKPPKKSRLWSETQRKKVGVFLFPYLRGKSVSSHFLPVYHTQSQNVSS